MKSDLERQAYFTAIYNEHFDSLSQYVLFKSPSYSDAEDVVSSVFASFYQYVVLKNKQPEKVLAYLIRMANHELHHLFKKRLPVIHLDFETNEGLDQIPDHNDLEEEIFEQFLAEELWLAVKELPDIDQKILIARYRFDLPFQEITVLMGDPVAASVVRLRCHRALKKLKRILLPGGDQHEPT